MVLEYLPIIGAFTGKTWEYYVIGGLAASIILLIIIIAATIGRLYYLHKR